MFIYRDEYYLEQRDAEASRRSRTRTSSSRRMDEWQRQMERVHNQADLIIAKQRHGPTGTIQLFFEAEFTRFADLDLQCIRESWATTGDTRRRRPGSRSRRHRRQLAAALRPASLRARSPAW